MANNTNLQTPTGYDSGGNPFYIPNGITAEKLANPTPRVKVPVPKMARDAETFVNGLDPAIKQSNDGLIRADTRESKQREDVLGRLTGINDLNSQDTYDNTFKNNGGAKYLQEFTDANTALSQLQGKFRTAKQKVSGAKGQSQVFEGIQTSEVGREEAVQVGNQAILVQALQGNVETARQIALDTTRFASEDRAAKLQSLMAQYDALNGIVVGQEAQLIETARIKAEKEYDQLKRTQATVDAAIQSGGATVDEMQKMADPNLSDTEKMSLAQGVISRTIADDRSRGRYVEDRGFNRGVLESDRAFNRGVVESDRNFGLQSKSLVDNPDGTRSIINLVDGSERKIQGQDYWSLYGGITGYGSSLWDKGVDADLKIGDPVFSPTSGEVIGVRAESETGGFGNQVQIRTDSGEEVWLSHLLSGEVSVGQRVEAGDIVGIGGNTGNTIPGKGGDGSHLDFTVKNKNGQFMSAKAAHAWANQVYKSSSAGNTAITLTPEQRQRVKITGLNDTSIDQALKDIARYGADKILTKESGFTDSELTALREVVLNEKPIQTGLSRENISKLFGIPDNDKRSGFKGWWGEANNSKLDKIMDTIRLYKESGMKDEDIMKLLQGS